MPNNKSIERYAELICRLSAKLEQSRIPYSDVIAPLLTRKEYEHVLKYVNDHVNYPDIDLGEWNGET